jgi:sarcosine oxidase gamma subunit
MTTHLTWSIEVADRCLCGGETVLAVAPDEWRLGDDDPRSDAVPVFAEVTAHVCIVCSAVVSVSVNIDHQPKAGAL